jgi:AraC-like DNA-binding protein
VDYQLIMPIRLMTAMDKDPVLRSRLHLLMEHREERQEEEDNWARTDRQVVQPIRTRLNCTAWSEDLIQRCVGLIRTHATQSRAMAVSNNPEEWEMATVRVLYPTMSPMSHSCMPNVRTIHRSEYILEARSMRGVRRGEELTISYTG